MKTPRLVTCPECGGTGLVQDPATRAKFHSTAGRKTLGQTKTAIGRRIAFETASYGMLARADVGRGNVSDATYHATMAAHYANLYLANPKPYIRGEEMQP